jgi:hypothetical protein
MGYTDSVFYLFSDYAQAIAGGVVALSAVSVIFRILWEFR